MPLQIQSKLSFTSKKRALQKMVAAGFVPRFKMVDFA
jgi:hypothetical protein